MTYLEVINSVLTRLREPSVTSVSSEPYTKLIGELVNDAQTAVDMAAVWSNQLRFKSIETTISQSQTTIDDVEFGSQVDSIWNRDKNASLTRVSTRDMLGKYLQTDRDTGTPLRYAVQGDDDGALRIRFHPTPDQSYTFYLVYVRRSPKLTAASDELQVPAEPVIFHAFAHAIKERGEDQGRSYLEALDDYRRSLSRHIVHNKTDTGGSDVWRVL